MGTIADELSTIPFLRRVPRAQLATAAPLWEQVSLAPGEPLWEAGEAVDALAILLVGDLDAELDGTSVGRVLPGEIVGEAAAFFTGTTRTATLRARTPAQVLLLPTASLRTLRWQRSVVYDALLDQALKALVRRVAATNARIARLATGGQAAPARVEPSALARLWRALRPGGPSGPCPPLEPLLRKQPGLADADGDVIAGLSQAFVAEPVTEGQVVFLEGEPGQAAWLVAEGSVDVLRHVRGDRAELLATLGPGSLFGINTLVEPGPRTASCVSARPGWLWRLDADALGRLQGPNRVVWHECMLACLATQIRNANGALQKATGATPTRPHAKVRAPDDGFADLLRASGWLEGIPEVGVDSVRVVVTEDQKRNPRKR